MSHSLAPSCPRSAAREPGVVVAPASVISPAPMTSSLWASYAQNPEAMQLRRDRRLFLAHGLSRGSVVVTGTGGSPTYAVADLHCSGRELVERRAVAGHPPMRWIVLHPPPHHARMGSAAVACARRSRIRRRRWRGPARQSGASRERRAPHHARQRKPGSARPAAHAPPNGTAPSHDPRHAHASTRRAGAPVESVEVV